MKHVWVIEFKKKKDGKWEPINAHIKKKHAKGHIRLLRGYEGGWYRLVKYVSSKKL